MKVVLFSVLLFVISFSGFTQQPVQADTTTGTKKNDSIVKPVVASQPQSVANQQKKHIRKDTRPLKDRIDWDFSTSFWASKQQAYFNASILVSYKFPKILSIGTGPVYVFSHRKDADVNLNGFGGQLFARAQLLKFFYLWTSYQGLSNQYLTDVKLDPVSYTWNRSYVDSWYAGAGVNVRFGRRFGVNLSVLYDFLYDKTQSPFYNDFIFQVGFSY